MADQVQKRNLGPSSFPQTQNLKSSYVSPTLPESFKSTPSRDQNIADTVFL
jgi:hypothetical protein